MHPTAHSGPPSVFPIMNELGQPVLAKRSVPYRPVLPGDGFYKKTLRSLLLINREFNPRPYYSYKTLIGFCQKRRSL